MKIGDKVRFLNDVGGGIVSGFQGKNIALICDADGFEIPTLISECVVIDTDNYNVAKPSPTVSPQRTKDNEDSKLSAPLHRLSEADERPITFRPRALERRGADALNLYLAFVPQDPRSISHTAFDTYFINDCNYTVRFALFQHSGDKCTLCHEAEVEANTKLLLDTLSIDELPSWERLTVQVIAYKRDKDFTAKAPINVGMRVDGKKFYKMHSFLANDFFDTSALLYEIVRDDRPVRRVYADAHEMQDMLVAPKAVDCPARQPARSASKAVDSSKPIEVDLHAHELLETTAGLTSADILSYQLKTFRETMEAHNKERGRQIVFIHGKGEGVLRAALLKELRSHYKHCRFQDASFREYGFGATLVTL